MLCPYRAKVWGVILAAALAAGSNVVVFQLLVQMPTHRIVLAALAGFTVMAMISGAVAGGGLALALLQPLRKAGVIHQTLLDRHT